MKRQLVSFWHLCQQRPGAAVLVVGGQEKVPLYSILLCPLTGGDLTETKRPLQPASQSPPHCPHTLHTPDRRASLCWHHKALCHIRKRKTSKKKKKKTAMPTGSIKRCRTAGHPAWSNLNTLSHHGQGKCAASTSTHSQSVAFCCSVTMLIHVAETRSVARRLKATLIICWKKKRVKLDECFGKQQHHEALKEFIVRPWFIRLIYHENMAGASVK